MPRLFDLVEVVEEARKDELFEFGVAMTYAMNEPKELKKLRKRTKKVEATGMIAIPKKSRKTMPSNPTPVPSG